jgi:hypothetical protein
MSSPIGWRIKMEDSDLKEMIREALSLYSPGHPDRSLSLNNLAIGVNIRYNQFYRMEDLEESITYQ